MNENTSNYNYFQLKLEIWSFDEDYHSIWFWKRIGINISMCYDYGFILIQSVTRQWLNFAWNEEKLWKIS